MIEVKFRGNSASEINSLVASYLGHQGLTTPAPAPLIPVVSGLARYADAKQGNTETLPPGASVAPEVAQPEKKKAGRPPKKAEESPKPTAHIETAHIETAKIEQPAPAPEQAALSPQNEVPAASPVVQYPTHEQALAAIKAITDKQGMEQGIPIARDCLSRFGYQRVSEVKEADRHEFIALCAEANELGAVPTVQK